MSHFVLPVCIMHIYILYNTYVFNYSFFTVFISSSFNFTLMSMPFWLRIATTTFRIGWCLGLIRRHLRTAAIPSSARHSRNMYIIMYLPLPTITVSILYQFRDLNLNLWKTPSLYTLYSIPMMDFALRCLSTKECRKTNSEFKEVESLLGN